MKKVYLTLTVAAALLVACGPSAEETKAAEAKENQEVEAQDEEFDAMLEDKAAQDAIQSEAEQNAQEAQEMADKIEGEEGPKVHDETSGTTKGEKPAEKVEKVVDAVKDEAKK